MKYYIFNKNSKNCCVKIKKIKKGFAGDISNILRRILLSSMNGTKIEYVKIKGIKHEFTYIDGITEDVLEILLNIRKIILKIKNFNKIKIKIVKKGPSYLRAGEINVKDAIIVKNKRQKICKINKGKKIEIKFKIVNYKIKKKNKRNKKKDSRIYIEKYSNPVENVKIYYNKIEDKKHFKMKIKTNGTVSAKKCFKNTLKIYREKFKI